MIRLMDDLIMIWSVLQSAPRIALVSWCLQITLTGDDIVIEMPMFGSMMHPQVLMSWLMFEAGIGDW